jgi:adenylosuccinate lyase
MKAWETHQQFLDLLLADAEVTSRLREDDLRGLFDYSFYTQNIGATFERLGL